MPSLLDDMITSLEATPSVEVPTELSQELVDVLVDALSDADEHIDPVIARLRERIDILESANEHLNNWVRRLIDGGERLTHINQQLHALLPADCAATVKLVGLNGCGCDFCSGKKRHSDNWCAHCSNVKLTPPKHWENLDACDDCQAALDRARTHTKGL